MLYYRAKFGSSSGPGRIPTQRPGPGRGGTVQRPRAVKPCAEGGSSRQGVGQFIGDGDIAHRGAHVGREPSDLVWSDGPTSDNPTNGRGDPATGKSSNRCT
ncbi:hypothetical protein HPB50_017880 [Hyalomma asiaticum]|uniref:Uncharacterized protein n=1 Tax=Hyalomma asiaticum TaxID=266040 RepID=A0ACB7RV60_HYAAI|nr:hypothetical protein HPB50_017880 [Hyalomma asiaticum]